MSESPPAVSVLHVDDDAEYGDLVATYLERADGGIDVDTVSSAESGLERLATGSYDCIVSDYDMPGRDGLEFLQDVRDCHEDIPFVLFTGKGSEEVAADAISAGVSEYLQKGGSDTFVLLANRIRNLVEMFRSEQAVETARDRFRYLVEESTDAILIVDEEAMVKYATPAAEAVLGRSPDALEGTSGFEPLHADDVDRVMRRFGRLIEEPHRRESVEFRYERPDGTWIWAEARGRNLLATPVIEGIVVYTRDITDRKEREQRFRAVFEEAFDAMIITDDEGRLLAVNEAACALFDLEASAIVDHYITDFLPEDVAFDPGWDRFKASDGERGRLPLVLPDGDRRTVEYAASADIVPGQHLSILRDVTDFEREESPRGRVEGT